MIRRVFLASVAIAVATLSSVAAIAQDAKTVPISSPMTITRSMDCKGTTYVLTTPDWYYAAAVVTPGASDSPMIVLRDCHFVYNWTGDPDPDGDGKPIPPNHTGPHALAIRANGTTLIDCSGIATYGDGLYIDADAVVVTGRHSIDAEGRDLFSSRWLGGRNGLFIPNSRAALVEDVEVRSLNVHSPKAGVDVEPRNPGDRVDSVWLVRVHAIGCEMASFQANLSRGGGERSVHFVDCVAQDPKERPSDRVTARMLEAGFYGNCATPGAIVWTANGYTSQVVKCAGLDR